MREFAAMQQISKRTIKKINFYVFVKTRWASGVVLMHRLILVVLTTLMLSASPSALAQLGPNDPLPNAQIRRSLAKQWASLFVALDRQIPTLSPSQERWLKTEYHEEIAAAGNRFTSRSLAAMDSIEYQIHIIKPRNGELVGALTQIANGSIRDKSQEVALWATVSDWLIDYQYWQAVNTLVKRGTVQKKIGHVDTLYFENYTFQARSVLSKIVVPHLEGRLP
jgi:hypothetical protein